MMCEKYSNFKSQTVITAQNDEQQRARELVLEKAKRKYEVEEARREKARKAGEGTWMIDSLSKRLDSEQKALDKAKKKKDKKEKKKKKKKKRSKSSSSSSDGESEPEWVEAKTTGTSQDSVTAPIKGPQLQRESWMEAPLDLIPLTSRQEIRERINQEKAKASREANKMLEPGQHVRELNPYWKDGGTGLPEENPSSIATRKPPAGDGGVSWLRTSLERCKQQAEDEGRSLEEVAAERWGSLKNLLKKLKEAEQQQKSQDARRRGSDRTERSYKRDRNDEGNDRRGDRHRSRSNSSEDYRRHSKFRGKHSSNSDEERHKRNQRRDRDEEKRPYRDEERRRDREGGDGERGQNREEYGRTDRSRKRAMFQRPGSDEEDDRKRSSLSQSIGFKRPSDDNGDSPERHSRGFRRPPNSDDSFENNSKSSKTPHSGRFVKPDDRDNGAFFSRSRGSSERDSRDVPRWKKKGPEMDREVKGEKDRKDGKRKKSKSPSPSLSDSSSSSSSENAASDGEEHKEADREKAVPVVTVLSEEELNDLAAKILRAEIMGEEDLAAELKEKLETARKHREAAKAGANNTAPDFSASRAEAGGKGRAMSRRKGRGGEEEEEDEDGVVVLSRTNKGGMVRPVLGETSDSWGRGAKGKRKSKNITTHDAMGGRTSYFDNDDKLDLRSLVEQERAGTAEDQNSMFARLAGRSVDKDLDVDDMFVSRAAKQQNEERTFDKDRAGAIFEHRKRTSAMEKCPRCLKQLPKHLIIALGTKSYLCLPAHRSLTEGHCLIVPMSHTASATSLDEDVWQEMQLFRKNLVQMFASQDQDVVVMETVMHLKHFPHTALECVPLEREVGDLAPIYFKKAIQDAGPEWSDNKKLHDLRGKDVRKVIPKGFPYFAVDFGLQSGFATVIEDETTFPAYFGREIVGGMIDAEPGLWRKPHKQSFEDQRQKVLQFEKWWQPYDWTQNINSSP